MLFVGEGGTFKARWGRMRGRTLPGEWACGEASECDGVVMEGGAG